jgi:phosphatidate cytidylyltransferase
MITAGLWLALRQRLQLSFIESVATGLLISVLAPLGDICESIVKRKAGVKDSSGFLPGLGGVLDVFDSILLSVPFYYLLLKIFAVI